jgi:hypothetical protein
MSDVICSSNATVKVDSRDKRLCHVGAGVDAVLRVFPKRELLAYQDRV